MKNIAQLVALGHNHGALPIHPYFGRMDPALAALLLSQFSKPGDSVLDPFCGSGTVLHEGVLLGRNVDGWDSSPLATMISSGKVAGVTQTVALEIDGVVDELQTVLLSERIEAEIPDFEPPAIPRVVATEKWFGSHALRELGYLRAMLGDRVLSEHAHLLLRIALSRSVTAASRQKGESNYTAVDKPDYPGRVIELFLGSVRRVVSAAHAFSALFDSPFVPVIKKLAGENYSLNIGKLAATISNRDARLGGDHEPARRPYDLVVTSPPYLMSWDYGLYHKFRFYWLGFDLDAYEDSEIGRHLRRKKDDVERYCCDMTASFEQLWQCVRSGAAVAMVNAPSAVYGRSVDTNSLLSEIAISIGFELEWQGASLAIPGPHHGMYASLQSRGAKAPGAKGKREHVLIFRRP